MKSLLIQINKLYSRIKESRRQTFMNTALRKSVMKFLENSKEPWKYYESWQSILKIILTPSGTSSCVVISPKVSISFSCSSSRCFPIHFTLLFDSFYFSPLYGSYFNNVSNFTFGNSGESGHIFMENGTRIPEFVVGNFRNGSYKFVGDKTDLLENGTGSVYHEIRLLHQPDIRWPGGSSTVPVSNPVCGFTGKDCHQEEEDAGEKLLIFFRFNVLYVACNAGRTYQQLRSSNSI